MSFLRIYRLRLITSTSSAGRHGLLTPSCVSDLQLFEKCRISLKICDAFIVVVVSRLLVSHKSVASCDTLKVRIATFEEWE